MDFFTLTLFLVIVMCLGMTGFGIINDYLNKGERLRDAKRVFHGVYIGIAVIILMGLGMAAPIWVG